jgi:hypothetical protein
MVITVIKMYHQKMCLSHLLNIRSSTDKNKLTTIDNPEKSHRPGTRAPSLVVKVQPSEKHLFSKDT